MECEHCNKHFTNKNTLKIHKENAKYCLKIQGRSIVLPNHICITCENMFTTKAICDKHMLWCKDTVPGQLIKKLRDDNEKLRNSKDDMLDKLRNDNDILREDNYSKEGMIALMQDKIDRQEEKISSTGNSLIDLKVLQAKVDIYKSQSKEKQDCLEQIAKQPKITTNTTNNTLNMHPLDLSDDRVRDIIEEYYNIDYLLAGSKGVAQFTIDKVLTKPDDKIIYSLTDRSREAYNFKNVEGVVEKDTKGRKLREVVYKNGIKEKAFLIANHMVLEDPVKAEELRCIEYALEVADLDPSTIRTKEVNDKVEHAYCKELRETAC
jgi:hypothetical protein